MLYIAFNDLKLCVLLKKINFEYKYVIINLINMFKSNKLMHSLYEILIHTDVTVTVNTGCYCFYSDSGFTGTCTADMAHNQFPKYT